MAAHSTIMGQHATALLSDDPSCKPKNHWHSVDAHFEEVVAISSLAFLPRKAAIIMIMGICHCSALELSMMQDQKSLTLCWRSFLGGGSDVVVGPVAHSGGQYYHYGLMLSRSPVIIQDARPEISDAPLTLISPMGQWACCLPFYAESRSLTPLWIDVTMQPIDCRKNQTKIVDAPLTHTLDSLGNRFASLSYHSVSNSSGPSLRVRVRVQTEPLPNRRSGLSINPNCQLGYGSKVNSQPVGIGRVVSASPSRSIYRFK